MTKKNSSAKLIMAVLGTGLLLVGITLVLVWWPHLVNLFKSLIGIILAVAGLTILYFAGQNK